MGKPRIAKGIHPSVKTSLGYDESEADSDVLRDWKARTRRVCKPCWELKYCPYGPLVEQSPLLPSTLKDVEPGIEYRRSCLKSGMIGEAGPLTDLSREMYERSLRDKSLLLRQAMFKLGQRRELAEANKKRTKKEKIAAWLGRGGPLPPIHEYRVPFEPTVHTPSKESVPPDIWKELQTISKELRERARTALRTGVDDSREPLDPVRRAWFEQEIEDFDPNEYPDEVPSIFAEASCNIFGHICPVFFAAEADTETEEQRRIGRGRIPFSIMMRIVRRDDYRCQHCMKKLRDDEVEFDHTIPVSRGGSSEEHNLRLTCFDCNRDKSDDFDP